MKKTTNPGKGQTMRFHGSYTSKILAARKERETPGSFIIKRDGRYYVLSAKKKRSNPPSGMVKIYDKITRIEGQKGSASKFPGEKFYHNFTKPYPAMYGTPDRRTLIIRKGKP